ncbi:MAG TPA: cytochrome c biogenesis protein [Coriobacteriia bacterium]
MKQLRTALVLLIVGGVLTTIDLFWAFWRATVPSFGTASLPNQVQTARPFLSQTAQGFQYGKAWFSQKIFYFHVPVAEASFLIFGVAAFFAIRFLVTRAKDFDTKSRIAMEVTLLFVILTMITGDLWTKASWGVWWQWEPRLTTYFIMTLLVIAYFVLRNSVEDEERRAVYAAVFCIIAFIDAPISFLITRLIPSDHPVVFTEGGLDASQLVPFIIGQIGMLMIGYAIYTMRMSEERLHERLDVAKESLEG